MIRPGVVTLLERVASGAEAENWTRSDAFINDTRASRHCAVGFASPSYREALPSYAYNGKITPAGNLFDPHVP
ncbi:hypothetical protein GCM10020367_72800 [Streptomyces sannanensis]|uniref:Uncharacterized protein n=1 Tax=Streptomyces sannanensis TaxID=285536 RepID=A0ABP6SNS1_9ACTN